MIGNIVMSIIALSAISAITASKFSGLALRITGSETIMSQKDFGTCSAATQPSLRWGASGEKADEICCHNRHYAEHSGYWTTTTFLKDVSANLKHGGELTFYDSVTGKPLFVAPRGRSFKAFVKESKSHGWPSFRDDEVVTENVRILENGEAVSIDGTHLGHNIPDTKGNRYCINIVSIAGRPQVTPPGSQSQPEL